MIKLQSIKVPAPFEIPEIVIPDFSTSRTFTITDYDAEPNDQKKTSRAIFLAIEAASQSGGGRVIIPAGTWLTGPIHLRSNVDLHLKKDALLLFSEVPEDYLPPVLTSWEGIECYNYSPLIYALDCENIGLSGEGKIEAKLDVWKIWYDRPKAHMDSLVFLYNQAVQGTPVINRQMAEGDNNLRPHFIQFNRCKHILVEDISIHNSPFWTLHPLLCSDVVIRRVKIEAHGHNNDGVDPEMSQNMLIEDCIFDQGDDAISVKSGREYDGWRLGVPTKNIVIRNCLMRNGHQLLAVGSELSAGIENVLVDHCHFDRSGSPMTPDGQKIIDINNILYVKTNERRGGYVKNIYLNDITATKIVGGVICVETDVLYQWRDLVPSYRRELTPIEGLYLSNIKVQEARFLCKILGEADAPVRDIQLKNIKIDSILKTAIETINVENFDGLDA